MPTCTPLWSVEGPVAARRVDERVDMVGKEEGLAVARAEARGRREDDIKVECNERKETKAKARTSVSTFARRARAESVVEVVESAPRR